jgi:hypothetical protein
MTWMWTEDERLHKFLKVAQKWMEFQTDGNAISEDVANRAFKKAQGYSFEIISTFGIKDDGTSGFLQSWVELGLFAGYLVGWKDADKVLGNLPTNGSLLAPSKDFYLTREIDSAAKMYALEATDEIFKKLFSEPISPLVKGLDEKFVRLLKVCHESSLYAGFLSGVEDAFKERIHKVDPFDMNALMS